MAMGDHFRAEAESVVRLAEAGIISAFQELVEWPRVAVRGIEVAERIERQAEGIDLAPGELLDFAAIGLDAIGVARLHLDGRASLTLHLRRVGKAVAAI